MALQITNLLSTDFVLDHEDLTKTLAPGETTYLPGPLPTFHLRKAAQAGEILVQDVPDSVARTQVALLSAKPVTEVEKGVEAATEPDAMPVAEAEVEAVAETAEKAEEPMAKADPKPKARKTVAAEDVQPNESAPTEK